MSRFCLKCLFAPLLILGIFLSFSSSASAKDNTSFFQAYGLLVHAGNQSSPVPRVKALSILLRYFADIQPHTDKKNEIHFEDVPKNSNVYPSVKKACDLGIFDCRKGLFNPLQPISRQDLLQWFYSLKHYNHPDYLTERYPYLPNDSFRIWLETRRLNLLSGENITHQAFSDLLYRDSVIRTNFNEPYRPGLILPEEVIDAASYHNLKELDLILKNLNQVIKKYEKQINPPREIKYFLGRLKNNLKSFEELKTSLSGFPYLLQERNDFDPQVAHLIRQYGLQEVLYSYTYDYSKNAPYRKYNLTTGVQKMNGRVFLPDEVLDYWKIISDKNLVEFKYGWVIAQGQERWEFGGGICGSSSMVFLPSWKSGLEVVERKWHSKYYGNLYPLDYIGLDATVYRPRPNLRIKNNLGSPIVYHVINDKENQKVTVEILGNRPYKNIRIEGPIFDGRKNVKWIRHIEGFDGKITSEELKSVYEAIY